MGEGITENRRLDQLEERAIKTEDKVIQLDKSLAIYSAIFEKNMNIQEKLSTAIDRLAETISDIQQTLVGVLQDTKRNAELQVSNSLRIGELGMSTENKINSLEEKLRTKIQSLDLKLNEVDDKGKFDFLKYIKENFVSISIVIYIIYDLIKAYFQK
jgi:hypothetical protein